MVYNAVSKCLVVKKLWKVHCKISKVPDWLSSKQHAGCFWQSGRRCLQGDASCRVSGKLTWQQIVQGNVFICEQAPSWGLFCLHISRMVAMSVSGPSSMPEFLFLLLLLIGVGPGTSCFPTGDIAQNLFIHITKCKCGGAGVIKETDGEFPEAGLEENHVQDDHNMLMEREQWSALMCEQSMMTGNTVYLRWGQWHIREITPLTRTTQTVREVVAMMKWQLACWVWGEWNGHVNNKKMCSSVTSCRWCWQTSVQFLSPHPPEASAVFSKLHVDMAQAVLFKILMHISHY